MIPVAAEFLQGNFHARKRTLKVGTHVTNELSLYCTEDSISASKIQELWNDRRWLRCLYFSTPHVWPMMPNPVACTFLHGGRKTWGPLVLRTSLLRLYGRTSEQVHQTRKGKVGNGHTRSHYCLRFSLHSIAAFRPELFHSHRTPRSVSVMDHVPCGRWIESLFVYGTRSPPDAAWIRCKFMRRS